MLSLGRIAPGGAGYYLAQVADGAEDYYLGHGEAPGRWVGSGCREFGLEGRVEPVEFEALLAGDDPTTGERLAAKQRRVQGWDFTFRAPKSVSLLYGLGDPEVAGAVVAAHEEAVEAALSWVEREALRSRRGTNGVEVIHTTGLAGAAFRHRTSRAGDPHLHTHVVVANLVRGTDGAWATPHSKVFHHLAATAGYLYEAHLRAVLTEELRVEWEPAINGIADIRGIDKDVRDVFSKRRAEIQAYLDEVGFSSPRAAEIATLATRATKDYQVDAHHLRGRWLAEAETVGFDRERLEAVLGQAAERELPSPKALGAMARNLSSSAGLTEQASTFTRAEVLRSHANAVPQGATVSEVEGWTDDYLSRSELRQLPGHSAKTLMAFHTTAEMLAIERAALRTIAERRDLGWGLAPAEVAADAVATRPSLSLEQVRMVEALTGSGHGVEAVVAGPGTGKTFTLNACRDVWETSGRNVLGCALAGRTAQGLEADTGIPSSTIAALLHDLDSGQSAGLPPGGVLVVDEAGQVGTRTLTRLLDHAGRAQVKVVLVGDPYQLPEIDAGGLVRGIESRFEVIELTENRRQREPWERAALIDLRHGEIETALDAYDTHGCIVRGDNAIEVRERLVADWWASRLAGEDAVMLAARRFDVDDLNARARTRMIETGALSGRELVVDERPYQAGDEVMTLRNARRLGVLNGTRATVLAVDEHKRTMTVRTTRGQTVELPAWYLDQGHVAHGYAMTTHKAQGMTVERAFVLGSDDLYRELGYTAMSRGTDTNRLYMVGGRELDPDDHPAVKTLPDPEEVVHTALGRSRAKSLALDQLRADPARRLRALHAERRRLTPVVANTPTDPAAERRALDEARQRAALAFEDAKSTLAAVPRGRRQRAERAWATSRVDLARNNLDTVDAAIDSLAEREAAHRAYHQTHEEALDRAAAVEREIEITLQQRIVDVEAFRPDYLTNEIDQPPDDPDGRAAWRRAATLIETQRAALSIDDEGTALGPSPDQGRDLAAWQDAHRDLDIAKTLTRLNRHTERTHEPPGLEPDVGLGLAP